MPRVRIPSPAPIPAPEDLSGSVSEFELTTVLVTLLVGFAGVIATLIAAFAGSYLAYHLSARREDRKLRESRVTAGNKALFTLVQQLNRLSNIRNQFIDPVRQNDARALAMRPVMQVQGTQLRIDFESLDFLLELKPHLCMALMLEQDRYETAESIINLRSRMHHDEVQPALEKAGYVDGGGYTPQQFRSMLGERLLTRIVIATDAMIGMVDEAILTSTKMNADLWAVLKEKFPEHKFIQAVAVKQDQGRP